MVNEDLKEMWELLDQIAEILDVPEYVPQNSDNLHNDLVKGSSLPEPSSFDKNNPFISYSRLPSQSSHSHGLSDSDDNSDPTKSTKCDSCSSTGSKSCQCSKSSTSQDSTSCQKCKKQRLPSLSIDPQKTFQRLPTSSSNQNHDHKPLNNANTSKTSTCHNCSSSSSKPCQCSKPSPTELHKSISSEQEYILKESPPSTFQRLPNQFSREQPNHVDSSNHQHNPIVNRSPISNTPTHIHGSYNTHCSPFQLPLLYPIPPLPPPPPCSNFNPLFSHWMGQTHSNYKPSPCY